MCFDLDSRPPIAPIAGGALDSARLVVTAEDGNRFLAFRARAASPTGAGIVVLPDVRGLRASGPVRVRRLPCAVRAPAALDA